MLESVVSLELLGLFYPTVLMIERPDLQVLITVLCGDRVLEVSISITL